MKALTCAALAAVALAGCTTSTVHQSQPITVQSVTVSPRVIEMKPTLPRGYDNRPGLAVPVRDIVRREMFVALKRSRYFAEVTGAVPETPRDSVMDLAESRRAPRATPGLSAGIIHLSVLDWGFSRVGLSDKREPVISIVAVLTDRQGQELARAQASAAQAGLPQRRGVEYLGDPEAAAIDLGAAAEVASRRLLQTMLAPSRASATRSR